MRAGLADAPWHDEWSSAAHHAGERKEDRLLLEPNAGRLSVPDWKAYLTASDEEGRLDDLRRETTSGWALGTPAFIRQLELKTGRRLERGMPGRPRKENNR